MRDRRSGRIWSRSTGTYGPGHVRGTAARWWRPIADRRPSPLDSPARSARRSRDRQAHRRAPPPPNSMPLPSPPSSELRVHETSRTASGSPPLARSPTATSCHRLMCGKPVLLPSRRGSGRRGGGYPSFGTSGRSRRWQGDGGGGPVHRTDVERRWPGRVPVRVGVTVEVGGGTKASTAAARNAANSCSARSVSSTMVASSLGILTLAEVRCELRPAAREPGQHRSLRCPQLRRHVGYR